MKNNIYGFGLVEVVATVAIVGVLALIASPTYKTRIAKTQLSEAISQIEAEKNIAIANVLKTQKCVPDSPSRTAHYGVITFSGTYKNVGDSSDGLYNTGCKITYRFNSSNVSKLLANKAVAVDVFNNGVISKNASTTVSNELLPVVLTTLTEDGPKVKVPVESGDLAYVAKDPEGGSLTGDLESLSEVALTIDSSYLGLNVWDGGYSVKPVVNAYDFYLQKIGSAPESGSKVVITIEPNVALVGFKSVPVSSATISNGSRDSSHKSNGALVFDDRWNNVDSVLIVNNGAILGAGGAGAWWGTTNKIRLAAEKGYTAMVNTSDKNIEISNNGVIAGGGGGGGASHGAVVGGGGSPYAQHYVDWYTVSHLTHPTRSSLLSGGLGSIFVNAPKGSFRGQTLHGGAGGSLGSIGEGVYATFGSYSQGSDPYIYHPAVAGKVVEGSFTITNTGSGWYKGSDMSSK